MIPINLHHLTLVAYLCWLASMQPLCIYYAMWYARHHF